MAALHSCPAPTLPAALMLLCFPSSTLAQTLLPWDGHQTGSLLSLDEESWRGRRAKCYLPDAKRLGFGGEGWKVQGRRPPCGAKQGGVSKISTERIKSVKVGTGLELSLSLCFSLAVQSPHPAAAEAQHPLCEESEKCLGWKSPPKPSISSSNHPPITHPTISFHGEEQSLIPEARSHV